ncbi:MAG: aspartate/glutamate racemase family protein, partial [Bacteroidota bacterium]
MASHIGMFDSGLGGLSVWRAVRAQLPAWPIHYVADQGHCPYGPRPLAEIQRFSQEITEFLLEDEPALIVVACNTATGAAIQTLRQRWPHIPFVGMEPALKPAAEATHSGVIGVLATQGTFEGDHFQRTLA